MEINRIKHLRKTLGLTQQEFADRLSVKRGTIANYEIGRNVPHDSVIALICREFHVNEQWLRTGEGEMLQSDPLTELEAFCIEKGFPRSAAILMQRIISLPQPVQDALVQWVVDSAAAIQQEAQQQLFVDAEVELYRQQLLQEDRQGSAPSSSTGSAAV